MTYVSYPILCAPGMFDCCVGGKSGTAECARSFPALPPVPGPAGKAGPQSARTRRPPPPPRATGIECRGVTTFRDTTDTNLRLP